MPCKGYIFWIGNNVTARMNAFLTLIQYIYGTVAYPFLGQGPHHHLERFAVFCIPQNRWARIKSNLISDFLELTVMSLKMNQLNEDAILTLHMPNLHYIPHIQNSVTGCCFFNALEFVSKSSRPLLHLVYIDWLVV